MGFYEKRFDSIQVLRGIAAFSVILHHIAFIGKGAFGVNCFPSSRQLKKYKFFLPVE